MSAEGVPRRRVRRQQDTRRRYRAQDRSQHGHDPSPPHGAPRGRPGGRADRHSNGHRVSPKMACRPVACPLSTPAIAPSSAGLRADGSSRERVPEPPQGRLGVARGPGRGARRGDRAAAGRAWIGAAAVVPVTAAPMSLVPMTPVLSPGRRREDPGELVPGRQPVRPAMELTYCVRAKALANRTLRK